jgi:hypothetical protein
MNMAKEKSPFRGFTIGEVNRAERDSYVVLIGNDFYSCEGDMVFTANQAEKHYETLLNNILHTMDNGTDKQKSAAMKCLMKLHILPLRLH